MSENSNRIIPYNKQIDGLRFIAIFSVLIGHFIPLENSILKNFPFGVGVNLFFVISGYLITKILLKNKEDIINKKVNLIKVFKSFYLKRTLRIFPIYYLTILFLLIINFKNIGEIWIWLISYSTNILITFDNVDLGSFNHLWSLAVEEQFYIVWPLLILLIPLKQISRFITFIIILSLFFKIAYYYYFGWSTIINASTISCADSLGFGALAAYWSLYNKNIIRRINNYKWILPLSFIPFLFLIIFPQNFNFIRVTSSNFLFSLFALFLIIKASEEKFSYVSKLFLENKLIVHIGRISYGIYLYHLFMPDLYEYLLNTFPNIIPIEYRYRIPIYFILSYMFAETSWYIIEKPLLKLKSKI